ncbi:alpha/beta fold hydrolase [Candidatus Microgenomates bacterium]|nr:alpha/beta fold hydrolase [Candidatus Microgenomates bacterium]
MRDLDLGDTLLPPERLEGFFTSEGLFLKYTVFKPTIISSSDSRPGILLLHGSSTAAGRGRTLFEGLQIELSKAGFASFAYDTRGVGESGGQFHDSTLINRFIDAQNAYEFLVGQEFVDKEKLIILGVSMGGHVAARFVGAYPDRFRGVILVNPAAYGLHTEDKRLRPYTEFTDAIAQDLNWRNSLAFSGLSAFQGPIMIADSEFDDVIPGDVKELYGLSANYLEKRLILPEIKHLFFSGTDEASAKARELFYSEATSFIRQL